MTLPGLHRGHFLQGTSGEHCVKFSTLEIIFCVFVAENYLVKVLTPLKGVFFSMPLDGAELSPDLFPDYRGWDSPKIN